MPRHAKQSRRLKRALRIPQRADRAAYDQAVYQAARAVVKKHPVLSAIALMGELGGMFGFLSPMMTRRERALSDAMFGGVRDIAIDKALEEINGTSTFTLGGTS